MNYGAEKTLRLLFSVAILLGVFVIGDIWYSHTVTFTTVVSIILIVGIVYLIVNFGKK